MTFFTHNMKLQLQALGRQALANDPKVVAILKAPSQDLTFYITEYRAQEDEFFGYVLGEGITTWGSFPRQGIEHLHEINQEMPEGQYSQPELSEPTPHFGASA
ncbi:MAG: hypothetical protein RLP14_08295 [Owenweeksia sp.]